MVTQADDQATSALEARQERAVSALIGEPTIVKAAKRAGVGERTLRRWLSDPSFCHQYRMARQHAFGQAIAMTQHHAPLAVEALVRVMEDPEVGASSRVAAAAAVLRFARELIELDCLAARLESLESRLLSPEPVGSRVVEIGGA